VVKTSSYYVTIIRERIPTKNAVFLSLSLKTAIISATPGILVVLAAIRLIGPVGESGWIAAKPVEEELVRGSVNALHHL
jgi:hypothetical protein